MNLTIARKEPSARFGLLATIVALFALHGIGIAAALFGDPDPSYWWGPGTLMDLSRMMPLFPIVVLLYGLAQPRVLGYEATLPIPRRELLLTKMATLFLAALAPVAAILSSIIMILGAQGHSLAPVLREGVDVIGVTMLVVVVWFAWRPDVNRLGVAERVGAALLIGLLFFGAVRLELPWVGLLSGAVSLPVVLWYVRVVPDSVKPGARHVGGVAVAGGVPDWSSPLSWMLLRTSLFRWSSVGLIGVPACLVILDADVYTSLILGVILFPSYARGVQVLLRETASWPFPRRRLVPYFVLPAALSIAVCAWWIGRPSEETPPGTPLSSRLAVDYDVYDRIGSDAGEGRDAEPRRIHVLVPAQAWRPYRGSDPPKVTAPWGETAELDAHPVFWGASLSFYNPYDVGSGSSLRFLGWQLSRAAEDIHGVDLSSEEALAVFLEKAVLVGRAPEDLSRRTLDRYRVKWEPIVSDDHVGQVGSSHRGWGVFALICLVVSFSQLPLFWRAAPARTRAGWRLRIVGFGLFWLAVFVLFLGFSTADLSMPHLTGARLHTFVDGALGSNPVGWLLLDLALVSLVCALIGYRIQRMEVSTRPQIQLDT